MVNWYTCRKRFSIDSRFFLYFHVLVVDEYKKFEVSAWILDCATSNLMPSDAAVQSQFSWLSEDFPKGTVHDNLFFQSVQMTIVKPTNYDILTKQFDKLISRK